jgi:bifunctional DNA-binding transcriptional regulator/antitoxin component of YhaV-PrlF toxin-antitoxin module
LKRFFLTVANRISSAEIRSPHPNPFPKGEREMRGVSRVCHRRIFRIECKKILCICFLLVLFLLTVGCEKSEVQILQERLDAFRNILPEKVREEFDSKNYDTVVVRLDSLGEHDPIFSEKYKKLKDQELINVFSSKEVVDYFKVYFVEKIEKLKGEKRKKW